MQKPKNHGLEAIDLQRKLRYQKKAIWLINEEETSG